ncbi:MAG: type II secretion system protein [Gammaproteobacteria bacterium]|nr:type II secretion system protein [Gammaproteobacteria bacterium]
MIRARGFTLLEILVALTLFAVVGGALLQMFHTGLRTGRIANQHSHAVLLARSKLTELSAFENLRPGSDSGEFDGGFHWRTDLVEVPDLEPTIIPLTQLELTLSVSWGQAGDESSITVKSLLLSHAVGS